MKVFLNGRFLPEEQASVSITDRGFLYGDGLFETVRVSRAQPFRWHQHWKRLFWGARFLEIPIPYTESETLRIVRQLLEINESDEAILRLTLTRGPGPRGYSPSHAHSPTVLIATHPAPETTGDNIGPWKLATSSLRVHHHDPLIQLKTCNKLLNIMARAEAESRGVHDALLLNQDGTVTETTRANLFWVKNGTVGTPPLGAGLLPGITRDLVLGLCHRLDLTVVEKSIGLRELTRADSIFVTLSSYGLVEISHLDEATFVPSPILNRLKEAFREAVDHSLVTPRSNVE